MNMIAEILREGNNSILQLLLSS